jgi:hypothetical protein
MTEDAKRAFARNLGTYGAAAAFIAVLAGFLTLGGIRYGDLGVLCGWGAAVAFNLLGTTRSTKGRWLGL